MLVGGTLTQLLASLGTPYAFDPPHGSRPVHRRSGRASVPARSHADAAAACRASWPRVGARVWRAAALRRAGRRRRDRSRGRRATSWRTFPGRCCSACRPATPTGACMTLPFGVRARVVAGARPALIIEEAAVDVMKRIHLIGICGTAMATLAAMLKSRGYDVRGSDQNVYPPMSDFLAEQQITTLQGYDAGAHHRRSRPRHRRQRDLARQPGARGGARPQDPVLLAARSGARSLPLGRAVGRHRRHARQDHDDLADRLGADARRRRSERAHRRHRRQFRRQLPRSAAGASSSSKGTSTTARSSTRPPSS